MKFAKFWKEVEVSVDKNTFARSTVSIWGASNSSDEDAKSNAEVRANKFKKLISNNDLKLQEYEYWNGYIREEVVDEVLASDGRVIAVLTRNSYGALVLNSESVFFGDIDVAEVGLFSRFLERFGKVKKDKSYYIKKVEEFQNKNKKYTVKVYETFAGLRVVITNELFDCNSCVVNEIFSALDTDPLYMILCKNQSCFRARLSPKPWRVNVTRPESRFPRKLQSEKDTFSRWLKNYQNVSANYAAAKLVNTFGSDRANCDVERVLSVHDKYICQENETLA